MKKAIKKVLLPSLSVFIISSFIHSCYNMLPCFITLIFFPINESIFEHLKMIYSAYILYFVINRLFLMKKDKLMSIFISSLINIGIFLIIYLPFYYTVGEKLILTLTLYFISIVITFIIKLKIDKLKLLNNSRLAICLVILGYIVFTFLSYNPPYLDLFIDHVNNKLGLKLIR